MVLKEFDFGSEAIAYIREQLADGLTLARHLLTLPLEQGRIRSYLPSELSEESRLAFHDSVYLTTRLIMGPEVHALMVHHIAAYLGLRNTGLFRSGGEHYAIFETYLGPTEPALARLRFPYFSCADEVYCFLSFENGKDEAIRVALRSVRDYPFVGVLTTMPAEVPPIEAGQVVNTATLEQVAAGTDVLIVGAYDGEGYLLWSRAHAG